MKDFVDEIARLWDRDIANNISGDLYNATFFGSEAGKKVLEDLIRFYYMPSRVELDDTHKIAFQQGQREVVHYILRRLSEKETHNE